MSTTEERVSVLEEQVKKEIEITPPNTCVYCIENPTYWDDLFKIFYKYKVGHEVEATTPCLHKSDDWLLWSHETAHFIGASFRDISKNLDHDFIVATLQDREKTETQFEALYTKWKNHSLWFELHDKYGKEKRFHYMEDFDEFVNKEKAKLMTQRNIEYEKAKECLKLIE